VAALVGVRRGQRVDAATVPYYHPMALAGPPGERRLHLNSIVTVVKIIIIDCNAAGCRRQWSVERE
jgi:hypothetical protein